MNKKPAKAANKWQKGAKGGPPGEKPASLKELWPFLKPVIFGLLILLAIVIIANSLSLNLPKLNAKVIDLSLAGNDSLLDRFLEPGLTVLAIMALAVAQLILGSVLAEKVGLNIRKKVAEKISAQSFAYVNDITPGKLLTNLTSDVDAVKTLLSQGFVQIVAALVTFFGAVINLIKLNSQLALPVLAVFPILIIAFMLIFKNIGTFFVQAQEVIDRLNKVINENIVGAAVVRVLSGQNDQAAKFKTENDTSYDLGIKITSAFASLLPIIGAIANIAVIIVVYIGGNKVINGELSLGDYTAFYSYILTLIFPIVIVGFISNFIVRGLAAFGRINQVLVAPVLMPAGTITELPNAKIEIVDVSLKIGEKDVLKDISFDIKPGSRIGILGPTASGKSQLLYLLSGLVSPTTGKITIADKDLADYSPASLYKQLAIVFQDSIMFNTSIRENIRFDEKTTPEQIDKALRVSDLDGFVAKLPEGLDTIVSERGSTLSGGQKQRVTLARALAANPKILLLDDFTARVDIATEKKIFANIQKEYPELTLILVTQKTASVKDFDQILLLMEGELLAKGTHKELMAKSIEYAQIDKSQQSANE